MSILRKGQMTRQTHGRTGEWIQWKCSNCDAKPYASEAGIAAQSRMAL